jgi:hypothetical protein
MCDYSLHNVAFRPAKVGDKLITTEFWNTTTRGFGPVGEPKVAVCLLPGTEVAFEAAAFTTPQRFRPLVMLLRRIGSPGLASDPRMTTEAPDTTLSSGPFVFGGK